MVRVEATSKGNDMHKGQIFRTITNDRTARRVCEVLDVQEDRVVVQWAGVAGTTSYTATEFVAKTMLVEGAAIKVSKNVKNDGKNYRVTIDGSQSGPVRFNYADTLVALQTGVRGEGVMWDKRWA